MTSTPSTRPQPIVVTGANGFVGSYVCADLSRRGLPVRAVVRRPGTAAELPGLEEVVGEFHDLSFAAEVCAGARAVVNTVHPMQDDDLQSASAGWAQALAETARDAGVERFVHVSTTAVYEREADTGDVDEESGLVDDSANEYGVTKRDTDQGIARVEGLTRIIVRPTAILGAGETSIWNTRRPTAIRDEEDARRDDPERTFGWVHVKDLASLIADLATGTIPLASDPATGPVEGGATPVNAVSGNVALGDYMGPVCQALGVDPLWESGPGFRSQLLAERARAWGWQPKVTFDEAMAELLDGLR